MQVHLLAPKLVQAETMITIPFQSEQWKYYTYNTNFLLSDFTAVYFVTYNDQTLKLFTAMQFSEAMPEVSKHQRWNLPFCHTYFFFPFLHKTLTILLCNFLSREAAMTVNFRLHWERVLQLYLELLQM